MADESDLEITIKPSEIKTLSLNTSRTLLAAALESYADSILTAQIKSSKLSRDVVITVLKEVSDLIRKDAQDIRNSVDET